MKKKLLHPYLLLVTTIAWTLVSLCFHDWDWFGRSGSVMTLAGAALTVRRLLILGPRKFYEKIRTIDGGSFPQKDEDIEEERKDREDATALHVGSWLVLVGTFIWGYGDRLGAWVVARLH